MSTTAGEDNLETNAFLVLSDRDQADGFPFLSPLPFHPFPNFFCCCYHHIELEFVNNLAGAQPTVVGIAEAKMNDLKRCNKRGEAGVHRGIFSSGTYFSFVSFLCPFPYFSHFWHLETYVFEATYKDGQPLYSSSNSSKPSS